MAASADKWLRSDGSVTTMAGERVLPPDHTRASLYENMTPNVAKWLLPDGSIVNELPVSGGGTVEIKKRPTLHAATSTGKQPSNFWDIIELPNLCIPFLVFAGRLGKAFLFSFRLEGIVGVFLFSAYAANQGACRGVSE